MAKLLVAATGIAIMPRNNGNNSNEDTISLSQVRELLERERAHFKELILQQEHSNKNFTQMVINTTNQRVDELVKDIQVLKMSLEFTQKDVDELKANHNKLSSGCNSNTNDICKVAESFLVLDTKANYLERQCRRNNIMVDGIPELDHNKILERVKKTCGRPNCGPETLWALFALLKYFSRALSCRADFTIFEHSRLCRAPATTWMCTTLSFLN